MAHNRTCEDIAKSGISEVITWIDRVFSAQSSVPDVRYPFLGSKISGDDTLGHAFVSKGDFVALSHNLPIIKERKRTGASYFVVEEHDISNLLS